MNKEINVVLTKYRNYLRADVHAMVGCLSGVNEEYNHMVKVAKERLQMRLFVTRTMLEHLDMLDHILSETKQVRT